MIFIQDLDSYNFYKVVFYKDEAYIIERNKEYLLKYSDFCEIEGPSEELSLAKKISPFLSSLKDPHPTITKREFLKRLGYFSGPITFLFAGSYLTIASFKKIKIFLDCENLNYSKILKLISFLEKELFETTILF